MSQVVTQVPCLAAAQCRRITPYRIRTAEIQPVVVVQQIVAVLQAELKTRIPGRVRQIVVQLAIEIELLELQAGIGFEAFFDGKIIIVSGPKIIESTMIAESGVKLPPVLKPVVAQFEACLAGSVTGYFD